MIGHRSIIARKRNYLKFLDSVSEMQAVAKQLQVKSWIEEVFSRPLPISEMFETRFGPAGYNANVLYSSSKQIISKYEFAYGLTQSESLYGKFISCTSYNFEIDISEDTLVHDVNTLKSKNKILNPRDYSFAHSWLTKQVQKPDLIKYESIRCKTEKGENYALYKQSLASVEDSSYSECIMISDKSEVKIAKQLGDEFRIMALR